MPSIKIPRKVKLFLAPTIYFALVIAMVVNVFVFFNQHYYLTIYVEGSSMSPTLNEHIETYSYTEEKGGQIVTIQVTDNVDFGFVDQHADAVKNIKRFDVVTVYYPWDNNDYSQPYQRGDKCISSAYFKIKRVIAIPGDTFKIVKNELYIKDIESEEWVNVEMPFLPDTISNERNIPETVVGQDEYWVAGDNWGHSADSFNHIGTDSSRTGPVYYENITGVLIAIQGTCTVKKESGKKDVILNHHYYSKPIYFN